MSSAWSAVQEALELPIEQDMVALREMTTHEQTQADYAITGLSPSHHWMEFIRPRLGEGVVSSRHLERLRDGTRLRIAGLVVCRQRPGTAKGFLFVTLEDERGLSNIIVRPNVYERYRLTWRTEPLILVHGVLQRRDGVVNVLADRADAIVPGEPLPVPDSKDFR